MVPVLELITDTSSTMVQGKHDFDHAHANGQAGCHFTRLNAIKCPANTNSGIPRMIDQRDYRRESSVPYVDIVWTSWYHIHHGLHM
jgi:hypothetical protein